MADATITVTDGRAVVAVGGDITGAAVAEVNTARLAVETIYAEILSIAAGGDDAAAIAARVRRDLNGADFVDPSAVKTNIGAADGSVYQVTDTDGPVMRRNDTGFGIDCFPSAPLQVGPNSGISDPNIVSGRTFSGAQAAYGHSFSDFPVINATLTGGDGEYAYNSYDARPTFNGSATYNHQAGYQNDPQFYGSVVIRDGWGYLSNGNTYDTATVQKYTHFLAGSMIAAGGGVGLQFGLRVSTLVGLSDQWAIYVDSDTNDSKLGRIGICLNHADYTVHPSQGIDYNAPPGLPAAMVFRVDMTAHAFLGVARSAGDFGIATAVGDFIYRLQTKPFLLSTDGGVSVNFRVDATSGNVTGSGNASFNGTIKSRGYTVATLPAAGTAGRRAYVSDATTPAFLAALTGGGAVISPVIDNGSAWVAG